MNKFKQGDKIITPEGNIGKVIDAGTGTIASIAIWIILDNGKHEWWESTVLKLYKPKREFIHDEEVWVKGRYQIGPWLDERHLVLINDASQSASLKQMSEFPEVEP